jgi:hypothetical protein
MRGKKRLSTREKFKGDLYWKHYNVLSFVSFLCCFCLHTTEYKQMGGGATKFSWAQGRKIPKYGPAYRALLWIHDMLTPPATESTCKGRAWHVECHEQVEATWLENSTKPSYARHKALLVTFLQVLNTFSHLFLTLFILYRNVLTLCRSNLNPYCLGRKAAFFQWAFTCT